MKEYPIEQILAESENLAKDIRQCRFKMLFELFATSFIIFFGFKDFIFNFNFTSLTTAFIAIVPYLNAIAWFFWAFLSYFIRFRAVREKEYDYYDDVMFRQIEYKQYILRRLKRTERIIDILTAAQIIIMSLFLAFSWQIRG